MATTDNLTATELDIIIIGAGISGINAAYRVQTTLPGYSYTILESRDVIGGTWDLFRYPGIRSDAELYTFGFQWKPWKGEKAIADGESILTYLKDATKENGIDKNIRFGNKLLAADWSSLERKWILTVDVKGKKAVLKANFIFMGTGYYDFNEGLQTTIPGLDTFKGDVVHPQFWPKDLDYTNKRVVIVGSGATAVTLLPVLAEKAEKVTMLQRTPGYLLPIASAAEGQTLRKYLPEPLAFSIIRWKRILIGFLFYQFCLNFPDLARSVIKTAAEKELPESTPQDPHFKPPYIPHERRVCFCPDGDFFKALHKGNAHIVTDKIQNVNEKGIQTESGEFLEADVIVTATGLKILAAGGAVMTKDGEAFTIGDKYLWNGSMLQDVPNAAFIIGYVNVAWTLGADASTKLICRMIKYMEKNGLDVAVPRLRADHGMTPSPAFNLTATYITKALGLLPLAGDVTPWRPRNNSIKDIWYARWGSLTRNMEYLTKDEAGKKID